MKKPAADLINKLEEVQLVQNNILELQICIKQREGHRYFERNEIFREKGAVQN